MEAGGGQTGVGEALLAPIGSHEPDYRRLMALLAVFFAGVVFWLWFFQGGSVPLNYHDWVKEYVYLDTLRDSLVLGKAPLEWDAPYYHETTRFLANPETLLTPDIVGLRWVSDTSFIMFHVLLLYGVGFAGSLAIARKLRAGVPEFVLFWLLFNFNGYVVAHLGSGHFQWTGYFLLPWFVSFASELSGKAGLRSACFSALKTGLVIGALILNGSVHFAVWCCVWLLIMAIVNWRMFVPVILAVASGLALGLGRLIPAAKYFPAAGDFVSGYPSLALLLRALVVPQGAETTLVGGNFGVLPWWEYNFYLGFVAVILLIASLIYMLVRRKVAQQMPMIVAALVFAVLSYGDLYFSISRLPFGNIERVSSRLIVVTYLVFLVVATAGLVDFRRNHPRAGLLVESVAGLAIVWQLVAHSRLWTIAQMRVVWPLEQIPLRNIAVSVDAGYARTVLFSWLLSILSLAAVALGLWWLRRTDAPAEPAKGVL